jgi:hypothetical protein
VEIAGKLFVMPSFRDLKSDTYTLILSEPGSPIELVSVILQTQHAVLLRSYLPAPQDYFRLKDETIHRLIEELNAPTARAVEALFQEEEKLEETDELFQFEEQDED